MVRIPTDGAPTHPGEMLAAEFLKPLGLSQTELAAKLEVSYPRVNELVHGKRGVTPDTALRLTCSIRRPLRAFGASAGSGAGPKPFASTVLNFGPLP